MTAPTLFPPDVRYLAHTVGNGELFWPLDIAPGIARHLANADLGICGGEIYVAQGLAWGNIEVEWTTEPAWRRGEPWPAYVERGLAQAAAALADAVDALPETEREPMCFLAFYREGNYPDQLLA